MSSLFTASSEDLKKLNDQRAVEFFRDLLRADARRINLTPDKIHVSEDINVADGGVDATVENDRGVVSSGIIKEGLNCYQIKTGRDFKPWTKSDIEKELFGKKKSASIKKEDLGDSIKNCLDNDGHYIIVCFGREHPIFARG